MTCIVLSWVGLGLQLSLSSPGVCAPSKLKEERGVVIAETVAEVVL